MAFKPAVRTKKKLRLALVGTGGSGKTWTALELATGVAEAVAAAEGRPARIAFLDTERGSASLYAGPFTFDVDDETTEFRPDVLVAKIREAEAAGYDVLVVDSWSAFWSGKGGALEMVDEITRRKAGGKGGGDSFSAWRDVTPQQTAMVDAVLSSKLHLILCMRQKTEWVVEQNDKGKSVPRRVGMAPEQRAGVEYEPDALMICQDYGETVSVEKSRLYGVLPAGKVYRHPDRQLGRAIVEWLGAAPEAPPRPAPSAAPAAASASSSAPAPVVVAWGAHKNVPTDKLTDAELEEALVEARTRLEADPRGRYAPALLRYALQVAQAYQRRTGHAFKLPDPPAPEAPTETPAPAPEAPENVAAPSEPAPEAPNSAAPVTPPAAKPTPAPISPPAAELKKQHLAAYRAAKDGKALLAAGKAARADFHERQLLTAEDWAELDRAYRAEQQRVSASQRGATRQRATG